MCVRIDKRKIYESLVAAVKKGDTGAVINLHNNYPLRLRWIRYACVMAIINHLHDIFDFLIKLLDYESETENYISFYYIAIANGNEHVFNALVTYDGISNCYASWFSSGISKYPKLLLKLLETVTIVDKRKSIIYKVFEEHFADTIRAVIRTGYINDEEINMMFGHFMYRRDCIEILQEMNVNVSPDIIISAVFFINNEGVHVLYRMTSAGYGAEERKQMLYDKMEVLCLSPYIMKKMNRTTFNAIEEILQGYPPLIGNNRRNILGGNKIHTTVNVMKKKMMNCRNYKDIMIVTDV